MHLTVLAVPDCPGASVLTDRLIAILDGRDGVSMSREMIRDEDEAQRRGMRGSPTLLIDGVDPFIEAGQQFCVSCRLYRDEHGTLTGAPPLSALRRVIEQALQGTGRLQLPPGR
jgi:predicted DsbA family dithiol-disulfide isomerase